MSQYYKQILKSVLTGHVPTCFGYELQFIRDHDEIRQRGLNPSESLNLNLVGVWFADPLPPAPLQKSASVKVFRFNEHPSLDREKIRIGLRLLMDMIACASIQKITGEAETQIRWFEDGVTLSYVDRNGQWKQLKYLG